MLPLIKKHNFDEVFDSQSVFKLVLEAISNPTRIISIQKYAEKFTGVQPTMLALAMTLIDNEVSFYACGHSVLEEEIISLTFGKSVSLDEADFVFVCDAEDVSEVIANVKCGNLTDPHKSATLIIKNEDTTNQEIVFYGPGIDGERKILVSELVLNTLRLRDQQYYEYPQGIDMIFLTATGEALVIPRLVRWEVK